MPHRTPDPAVGAVPRPTPRPRPISAAGVLPLASLLVATAAGPAAAQQPAAGDDLPRVVVLATGGTIASRYDPEAGALRAALTGEEIVAAVPGLAEVARVSAEQIVDVNSWDLTPATWRQHAQRAETLLAAPDV